MNPGKASLSVKLPSNRSFGALFTSIALGMGIYGRYKGWHEATTMALFAMGFLLLLATVFLPAILTPFNKAWYWLGQLLGKVFNPIVMGILFFLLVTPIAAIGRLFGRDELRLKKQRHPHSYWIDRVPPGPEPDSFKHPF